MWFQRQRICLYFQICWWAIQKRFLFKAELHRGTAPTSSLDLWVMQSYYTPGIAGYEENKPVILDLYKHMFACEYFAKAKYKIVQSHLSRQEKRTCWNAVSELMGIAFKIIHIYIYKYIYICKQSLAAETGSLDPDILFTQKNLAHVSPHWL